MREVGASCAAQLVQWLVHLWLDPYPDSSGTPECRYLSFFPETAVITEDFCSVVDARVCRGIDYFSFTPKLRLRNR